VNDDSVMKNFADFGSIPNGSLVAETAAMKSARAAPSGTRQAISSWPILAGVADSDRFFVLI
jgi:hypothetical protein